jgi:hypothetical protein
MEEIAILRLEKYIDFRGRIRLELVRDKKKKIIILEKMLVKSLECCPILK